MSEICTTCLFFTDTSTWKIRVHTWNCMRHFVSSRPLRPHATQTTHSNLLDLPLIITIILSIVPTSTDSLPEPKRPKVDESSGSPPEPKRPRGDESSGSPPEPKRPRGDESSGSLPDFKMDNDVSSGSGKWWRDVLFVAHCVWEWKVLTGQYTTPWYCTEVQVVYLWYTPHQNSAYFNMVYVCKWYTTCWWSEVWTCGNTFLN